MKLLLVHLLETAALRSDGVAVHVRALMTGLARAGHEVTLVSFGDVTPAARADYRRHVAAAYQQGAASGVRETFKRRRDLVAEVLHTRLNASRPDAILAQGPLELTAVPEEAGPCVLTLHAFRSADELRKGNLGKGSSELGWFRAEENRALARAQAVVAVSRPYLDEARRRGARTPVQSVVANGVDLARFGPGENLRQSLGLGARPVLGVLGRLSRQKGHDILLRAFTELRPLYPECVLLVGGDGELRRALEEQAAALGIGDAVRWLGEVADTPAFFRTLDVAVLPSRWEGMPFVLLEYGAAGLPVVASDVGGVGELIADGDDGLLVPAEDPARLTAALAACLADPDAARARGAALREKVATQHSLERMAQAYVEVVADMKQVGNPTA